MSHKSLIENLTILRGSHIEANENIRACIIDEAIQVIQSLQQQVKDLSQIATMFGARVNELQEQLAQYEHEQLKEEE